MQMTSGSGQDLNAHIPSEDIIILVCFDGYRYCVSLCAVCRKAELVEKKRWTVFPMVCWTAGMCSSAGCAQGQGCMEPMVSRCLMPSLLTVVANKPYSFPFCLVVVSLENKVAVAAQRLLPPSLSPAPPSRDLSGL